MQVKVVPNLSVWSWMMVCPELAADYAWNVRGQGRPMKVWFWVRHEQSTVPDLVKATRVTCALESVA